MAADYSHPDLRRNICLDHLVHILEMMFSLSIDEATALLVAGQIVQTQYELENEIRTDAYEALRKAVEKFGDQLWGVDDRQRTSP